MPTEIADLATSIAAGHLSSASVILSGPTSEQLELCLRHGGDGQRGPREEAAAGEVVRGGTGQIPRVPRLNPSNPSHQHLLNLARSAPVPPLTCFDDRNVGNLSSADRVYALPVGALPTTNDLRRCRSPGEEEKGPGELRRHWERRTTEGTAAVRGRRVAEGAAARERDHARKKGADRSTKERRNRSGTFITDGSVGNYIQVSQLIADKSSSRAVVRFVRGKAAFTKSSCFY